MKADKKEEKRRQQLAVLMGMEAPEKLLGPTRNQRSQDISREGEAVIRYLNHPGEFKLYGEQTCDNPKCRKKFMTNRGNVGSCSDQCRADILAERGLDWDWSRAPDSRWSVKSIRHQNGKLVETSGDLTNEPLVIGEAALAALDSLESLKQLHVEDHAVVNEIANIVENVDDTNDIEDLSGFLSQFD